MDIGLATSTLATITDGLGDLLFAIIPAVLLLAATLFGFFLGVKVLWRWVKRGSRG